MLSVDTALKGEQICLRPSMIKFPSDHTDVEICSASTRSLKFALNRQLITILAGLGVPASVFLTHQARCIDRLRKITSSAVNTRGFLEENSVGQAIHLPWLIEKMRYISLDFRADSFLRNAVELIVLAQLRQIKYRGRIPITKAWKLLGVMDETGFLKEGEIYCATAEQIILGKTLVTRSPAMHPGDIQFANAVRPPIDSPLLDLFNCVVFSQHGSRDLPSQLSGGDLDGDHFDIIQDETLFPPKTHKPADYPRVPPLDIGRPVEVDDITKVFIQFIQQDQLGRVATQHLCTADIKGVFSKDCIKLAELHSTAVDFQKTGIAVSVSIPLVFRPY